MSWQGIKSFAGSLDSIINRPKTFMSKLCVLLTFLIVTSLLPVGLWLLYASPLIQGLPFYDVIHIVFVIVAIILFIILSLVMYVGFGYWGALVTAFRDSESGFLNGIPEGQAYLLGWIRFFVQLLFVAIAGIGVAFILFNVLAWQVLPNPGERTGIVERAAQVQVPQEWKLKAAYATDPTSSSSENIAWPADTTLLFKKRYNVPKDMGVQGMQAWIHDASYWKSFGILEDIECEEASCSADVHLSDNGAPAGSLQNKFIYQVSADFSVNEYSTSSDEIQLEITAFYQR